MSRPKRDLNDGSVAGQLLRVGAPMSLGLLSVLAVGLTDAFFLARVGNTELTAVGFVYPVLVVFSGLSVGLSAGANTALSQARGAHTADSKVGRLALHASALGLAMGILTALVLWLIAAPLFSMLGAKGVVLNNILAYLPYWLASFPVLVVTMVLNSAFRAAGDGKTAAVVMVVTAFLNIALTPVLIFGYGFAPELGMAGASLGTLIARAVVFLMALVLAINAGIIIWDRHPFRGFLTSLNTITGTALPAALSRAINPAGMAMVTSAVATVGDAAVAGFGAATRVQAIALVPFLALASGLGPVVGQAWGANDTARARTAMRDGAYFCLAYGIVLGLGMIVFADALAQLMTAGRDAATYTADYLRFVGWTLGGYGLVVGANAAMTGRSRANWAMGLSLARIGLIFVPGAWLGVWLLGYPGILAAAALANITAVWGALVALRANRIGPSDLAFIRAPALRLSEQGRDQR